MLCNVTPLLRILILFKDKASATLCVCLFCHSCYSCYIFGQVVYNDDDGTGIPRYSGIAIFLPRYIIAENS